MIVPRLRAAAGIILGGTVLAACGQFQGTHDAVPSTPPSTLVSFTDGTIAGPRTDFVDPTSASEPASVETGATELSAGAGAPLDGTTDPLLTCPVRGRGYYVSNFGAYRAGPPVHAHQGNDIVVPYGTPVVAPFDGFAVATPNVLGGKAVRVFGPDGYVYNAHLSRYGHLGHVSVGDVVGLVGTTGNAPASLPHDHFEWHPNDGAAVDPSPYLNDACPST